MLPSDGSKAYVPSKQDNILASALRGDPGMTFDRTVRAVTSVVDLHQNNENPGGRLDHDNASAATAAAFSGDATSLIEFLGILVGRD